MTDALQNLITALRQELQDYGEMLSLLDRQQELIFQRAANEVLEAGTLIQEHAATLQAARTHREECQNRVAQQYRAAKTEFSEIIPLLPRDYQPLIQALVEENNQLLARIRHRAQQNHLLLARSLEMIQRLIHTLVPATEPAIYNGQGLMPAGLPDRPLYEAIG